MCRELMRALVRGSAKKFRAPSILWANFGLVEDGKWFSGKSQIRYALCVRLRDI